MNLDALGNIGDFVSGIGVVASLIYLATQIRHAKSLMETSVAQARFQSTQDLFLGAALSDRLPSTFEKILDTFDDETRKRHGGLPDELVERCGLGR